MDFQYNVSDGKGWARMSWCNPFWQENVIAHAAFNSTSLYITPLYGSKNEECHNIKNCIQNNISDILDSRWQFFVR